MVVEYGRWPPARDGTARVADDICRRVASERGDVCLCTVSVKEPDGDPVEAIEFWFTISIKSGIERMFEAGIMVTEDMNSALSRRDRVMFRKMMLWPLTAFADGLLQSSDEELGLRPQAPTPPPSPCPRSRGHLRLLPDLKNVDDVDVPQEGSDR